MPLGAFRLNSLAKFTLTAAAEVIRNQNSVIAYNGAAISTTQYKFGGSSAYVDGVNDYFQIKHSNIVFGTDDFTIEFWWRPTSRPGNYPPIITNFNDSYSANEWGIFDRHANASTKFGVDFYNVFNGGQSLTSTTSVSNGTWYHIAVVRSGTTFTLYINGTSEDTTTSSASIDSGVNKDLFIGAVNGNYGNGHIDELRISNTARYSSNFTPATTPFVNDDNTLLLLHMDGTNGQTYLEDDNGVYRQRLGIGAFGAAALSTTQSKFGGTSLGFGDGVSDYYKVYVPSTNYFGGTGDQTCEFWYWRASSGAGLHLTDFRGGNTWTVVDFDDGRLGVYQNGYYVATNFGMPTQTWTHVAIVRQSTSLKWYKNGTLTDTNTIPGTAWSNRLDCFIGANWADQSAGNNTTGYIDEFRISNIARYTANFTAPTAPFVHDEYTKLLIHANGTNGQTVILDDNGVRTQKELIVQGNCQIDTAQSKFGGSSMLTDGTNDALKTTGYNLTGDWTFEGWYRINTGTTEAILFRIHNSSNTFQANYGLLNRVIYTYQGGTTQGSTTLSTGVWYHLAFVRSGSTVSLYVNGTREATRSYSSPPNNAILYISGTQDAANLSLNGWSDEIRISSTARYSGTSYTVPTAPFQNDDNTLLLLHMDGTDALTVFVDDNGATPNWAY